MNSLILTCLVFCSFLRDYAETRGFMLGRPTQAIPTPDGQAVLFLRSEARTPKMSLYEFDMATQKTRQLLSPEQILKGASEKLTPEEKARRERMRVSTSGFTDYQISEDSSLVLLSLSRSLYVLNRSDLSVSKIKTPLGTLLDPKFSPDSKSVSYVLDNNIYIQERQLTTGGTQEKTNGLAEFVAQEEMGRFTGYWWSPDSKMIVYEEADARGVEIWHIADPAKPNEAAQPFYYPRPGMKNVSVRLGIISVQGGPTTWIHWDNKKYPYLAQVRWEKNGPLTLTVQSRLQNELVLLKVDSNTGKTSVLIHEKSKTWINLQQDSPRWLPDNQGFLWISDGFPGPKLELRSVSGQFLKTLVPSNLGFQKLISTRAYLASQNPMTSELYILDGLDQKNFVVTNSTSTSMPKTSIYKADGTLIGELPSVAEKPPFIPRVQFEKSSAIIRPQSFNPQKKYPVLVDVYGGPLHQQVLFSMRNWLRDQWLADQGFIVVAIENRGTPNRGYQWERDIYKKFGSVPLEDQVAELQALGKKFPELDLNRVGIFGWSFGGYMSALAVLKRPDIFKAAVAGAPVTDWEDYDTHYTERYLGLPEKNRKAYEEASLLTYADKLERPLLLVHGTNDDNVYFRHSLKLADALFKAGKDFEILPLSSQTHMVSDPLVTERLWNHMVQYFRRFLCVY
ncbi:MAG: DPP IV N-terminal domain-containing protein [Myxococcaceae bacterium]